MDHATLTDNNGKKADFRNVVLIMTTNAGAEELSGKGIGFENESSRGKGRAAIERTFSPEFRNRLDAWSAFEALSEESIRRVVVKFLDELRTQLAGKEVEITVTDGAINWLANRGFDKLYGARPMSRLMQTTVKKKLVDAILFGPLAAGGTAVVDVEGDEIAVKCNEA